MYLKNSAFFVIINYVIARVTKKSQVLKNKGEIHMKTKYAVKPSMGGGYIKTNN